jgi:hypothetical protein
MSIMDFFTRNMTEDDVIVNLARDLRPFFSHLPLLLESTMLLALGLDDMYNSHNSQLFIFISFDSI